MKFKKITSLLISLSLFSVMSLSVLHAEDATPPGDSTPQEEQQTPPSEHKHEEKHDDGGHHEVKGADLPLWSVIPFALLLLSIAIFPVASHASMHWWENNNNKLLVASILGAISFFHLMFTGWGGKIFHQIVFDYIPFIVLLFSLFYISGGIVLRGDIEAKPINNLIFLLVGSFLASFVGTTGASMLLIRPLLKTNSERKHIVHTVVFFIFMVSNIGGSLTPLGDPPLFLGYLQGVPFTWTFSLFPEMLVAIIALSIIYFIWDTIAYGKETKADLTVDRAHIEPISLAGQFNLIWLIGIILCVAFINSNYIPAIKHNPYLGFIREALMLGCVYLSKVTSNPKLREENKFTLHPIQEVAYLFIGIFITMIPALVLLEENGSHLGVTKPWQFFWATGIFSSFLDNAPTYLTFLSLLKGLSVNGANTVPLILASPEAEMILKGISVGAVFMGANTYIGNAPNFMVKSVAEETGVKMPSFGGYILYSFGILIPLFVVIMFIFF
ncbi:MAG: sodium:proton antiporter [Leptospiraceae bacterium]|nr:sodium:proton antiporter [Leptospiraceae bacterium]